jgi:hypothetical protein
MALADIRQEVIHTIAQTNEEMREARACLEDGSDREKVGAAGELDYLFRRRALLGERLATLDWRIAEHRTLFAWLRQVLFSLRLHFESWIAHG